MKKGLVFISALIITLSSTAQVFNTAKTLKEGTFAIGVQPMLMTKGSSDFILFGQFGYGIKSGIDLNAKASVFGSGSNYFGIDIEFNLEEHFSLSGGAHVWGDFGLDVTALGTIDLKKGVALYGGLDVDMNIGNDDVYFPLWIPVGIEVLMNKNVAILVEASIGLTSSAPHLISGGFCAYF